MTHRVFSRNAGSSRARPSATIIDSISKEPWGPLHWGKNQSGMQAHHEHDAPVHVPVHLNSAFAAYKYEVHRDQSFAQYSGSNAELWTSPQDMWHFAAWVNGTIAGAFDAAEYHKQIVNRITEPYNYIDVVLTSTCFANWYALRDHPDAQPEIRELAAQMKEVQAHSKPELLKPGEWHLPYIQPADVVAAKAYLKEGRLTRDEPRDEDILEVLRKASAARCARVSYKLFDGSNANITADLLLFNRLLVSQPLHASPAEHQATPDVCLSFSRGRETWEYPNQWGNLEGWRQFRKMLPNEYIRG